MCPRSCWVLGATSPGQSRVTELSSPPQLSPGGRLSGSPAPGSSSAHSLAQSQPSSPTPSGGGGGQEVAQTCRLWAPVPVSQGGLDTVPIAVPGLGEQL